MTPKQPWDGAFVQQALNIEVPAEATGFEELVGLALRKNKKRAHLLVSKVLGKHIPQRPYLITLAAHSLTQQMHMYYYRYQDVFLGNEREFLAEEHKNARTQLLQQLKLDDNRHFQSHYPTSLYGEKVTVFGYAETATSLGALVAEHLSASYIHSTRYPSPKAKEYGNFDESHSHASVHHITPQDVQLLDDSDRTLILVDDELTTGETIMNTIRLFQSKAKHEEYYVATLTDLRNEQARQKFIEFEKELGIKVTVFSLLSTELDIPDNSVEIATPVVQELKHSAEPEVESLYGSVFVRTHNVNPGNLSLGVNAIQLESFPSRAKQLLKTINPVTDERILVLGVEENMYFPLMVARFLESRNPHATVRFSSSTRSPVIAYDNDSYAIKNRVKYNVPDDDSPRYAYNIDMSYDRIILLMDNPQETQRNAELITVLAERTKVVEVIESHHVSQILPTPLYGPKFGSYQRDDVRWLLKDLSNVELEAPTEEREEAIQNGGAHYAESLPVEFMPSEEYTELFKSSLEANKQRLAEAVGVVAEQAYELRSGHPVIVSLARAGVPVGILMKRYLKHVKKYDAPHYAISIVRGKGIDINALHYIAQKHHTQDVIFVDGWTGKGAITQELQEAVSSYNHTYRTYFSSELAVLADPGSCVNVYGTREDYLIPSACLNSTVSGLISRTVLNDKFIQEGDYHGAKFYSEFSDNDMSNYFLDSITAEFTQLSYRETRKQALLLLISDTEPTWSGWNKIEELSTEYDINNVNLLKPGVGETTRVLLRRVPWRILVRPQDRHNLKHVLMLAEERGVVVEEREDLPYACVGLIHPKYTKGATGFDGGKA